MKCSSMKAVEFMLESTLALAEVEEAGLRVDMKGLNKTINRVKRKIERLEEKMKRTKVWKKWQRMFGRRAKIGSREQLGKVLFSKEGLGYKAKEYTLSSYDDQGQLKADARAKTDKTALEDVDIPFVHKFLRVEELKKIHSTYLIATKNEAAKHKDGNYYVHSFINLNTAATYRSSQDRINLQNQPHRNAESSRMVRQNFLPHPDHHLVDFDFSTLEVRIGHCYHKDPMMYKYLTDPTTDMHRDAASDLFFVPTKLLDKFSKEVKMTLRHGAKNMFVFPQFYGSVYFQCAKNIWRAMNRGKWKYPGTNRLLTDYLRDEHNITRLGNCDPEYDAEEGTFEYHVKEVEKKLWKRFAVYAQWKKDFYQDYLDKGYFEFLTGFVVSAPHKKNDVTNYPIQGAAFHCLEWCLNELLKWKHELGLEFLILNEVHDSMTMSIPPHELQLVIHKVHEVMTVDLPAAWSWITIPLEIEVEVADVNRPWSEQVEWIERNARWQPKSLAV